MDLSDFDYAYPPLLIAQHPLPERDASRMMVVDRSAQNFRHAAVRDLPHLLRAGDLLVVNDTKVLCSRLFGEYAGGRAIEILLVEEHEKTWRCLTKKAKRIRLGEKIFFGLSAQATVVGWEEGYLLIAFEAGHRERAMERRGAPPLPPYIERQGLESYSPEDRERYQTIFAEHPGSAAAPTAGLHLSEELLAKLRGQGVEITTVTLHVGLDTFRPIRAESIDAHKMHGEHFEISKETAEAVNRAKQKKRRVIACGTTTVRALESSWSETEIIPTSGVTDIFIKPGYAFHCIDGLLTNFHLPKSTLLLLVSAFAGRELIMRCYAEVIRERYRLFSFGDCMLIF